MSKGQEEMRKIEQELHFENEFINSLLDSSPAYFVAIDSRGRTKFMNDSMLDALGYTLHEVVGRDYLYTFVPEQDRDLLAKIFHQIHQKKATINENHILTKDSRELLVEWHGCPVENRKGNFDYFFGVGIDITERRVTEEKLKKEQIFINSVINTLPDTFFVFEIFTGRPVRWNKALSEISGYTDEEISKMKLPDDLFRAEDRQKADQTKLKLLQGETAATEMSLITKDGRVIPTECSSSRIPDETGTPKYIFAASRDITERKQVEEALKQNEQRLDFAHRAAKMGMFDWDVVNNHAVWNERLFKLIGLEPQKPILAEEDWLRIVHPEDRERVKKEIRQTLRDNIPYNTEYRIIWPDNSVRWMSSQAKKFYDENNRVIRMIGAITDITVRKQMESVLKRERDRAEMYLDVAEVMLVVLDQEGRIELINRRGCHVLEYEKQELIGEDYFEKCVPVAIRAGMKKVFRKIMAGEIDHYEHFESFVLTSSGEQRLIAWHNTVLRNDTGHIIGELSSGEDISERKQAEAALHKALAEVQRMKEMAEKEQAFTKAALDAQRDTFFVFELATGKPIRWNKAFSEISGYTDEEIAAMKAPDDWCSPEDLLKAGGAIERILKGEPATVDMELITKEGRRVPAEYISSVIKDEQGNPKYIIAIGRDVAERRKAEERLRSSEQEQRNLIENMPIACFKFDEEGHILSWNRAAEEIYGYTKEEAIGKSAYDLIVTPATKEMTDRTIRKVFSAKTVKGTEWQDKNKSGEIGWRIGNNFPLLNAEGGVKCGVNLNIDITEKKRAEQRLSEAYQEIQQLNEQIRAANVYLQQEIRMTHLHGGMVGHSEGIKSVMISAEQVAATDSTVLIMGETGTGKELLARAIHNMSSRKDNPFVIVNCAAIPDTLVESELFGREKGAYTGADARKIGRFEIASGSTIFLDEIGELSLDMQAKLLRVLQEGQIERLGSTQTIDIDVRVIAATNRNLEEEIKENRFREDLYYRLNVFPITIPPLRERKEDIPELIRHFINQMNQKMGKRVEKIPAQSLEAIENHTWPGNIRELHNVIEKAMIQAKDEVLRIGPLSKTAATITRDGTLAEVERQHIMGVLEQTGWRVRGKKGAAEILGLKATTLEARMSKLGIKRSASKIH